MLPGKGLPLISAHLAPGVHVTLISDQHDYHIWVSILSDFLQPAGKVDECVPPGDVVDQKSTRSASEVRPDDAFERLLTCGVPDLQLDVLASDLDRAGSELHSNRQIVLRAEPFVCELQQQARFSHAYNQ